MPKSDPMRRELDDIELKLRSAQDLADAPGATEKDRADLKLIEQEYLATRRKVRHGAPAAAAGPKQTDPAKTLEKKLDEALEDTFPASDPVSFVEAAPVKEQDRTLPAVEMAERQQPGKTAAARKSR